MLYLFANYLRIFATVDRCPIMEANLMTTSLRLTSILLHLGAWRYYYRIFSFLQGGNKEGRHLSPSGSCENKTTIYYQH